MKPSNTVNSTPPLCNTSLLQDGVLQTSATQSGAGSGELEQNNAFLKSRRAAVPPFAYSSTPEEIAVKPSGHSNDEISYGDGTPALTSRKHSDKAEFPVEYQNIATARPVSVEPQQIGEGVFVGEGRTKNGEKFYLRMELVSKHNAPHWRQYVQTTTAMAGSGHALLKGLALHTHRTVNPDSSVSYTNKETSPGVCGFSDEEFQEFISLLGTNGFVSGADKAAKSKRQMLTEADTGAGHLSTTSGKGQYIVSASKTRDFSMQRAGEPLEERMTLKTYIARYSDLIMCVGADFSSNEKGSFHSRGIFRNPYCTIENTYKGISMLLHGFTGTVAQKFFPEKLIMVVRPVASMQHIICRSLSADDCAISGRCFEDVYRESADKESLEFPENEIKVTALARLYCEHAKT
jgi:hypothetical protein